MGDACSDACVARHGSLGRMNEGSEMISEGLLNKVCVVGQAGEEKHYNLSRSINVYYSLEADESSVDLANTGEGQHYLPPVLWILL